MSRKYFLSLDYMETLFLKSCFIGDIIKPNNYELVFSFTIYPVKYNNKDLCLDCGMRFNVTQYLLNACYDNIIGNKPFNSEFMSYDGVTLLVCSYLKLTGSEIELFYNDLYAIMNKTNIR